MKLKTAVIGVGYLGRFHAQKYAQLENCDLVGVVDSNPSRAQEVGTELGVPAHSEYEALLEQVDAVSIAVPTLHHYRVAKDCIERGVHVLIEKPFAATCEEARELKTLAESHSVCLQVGHLQRFNAIFVKAESLAHQPHFMEAIRIAPFLERGTDVDVILDLMIHDIDLILALRKQSPTRIDGAGVSVLTQHVDLASARLHFPGGAVANLTASRVSDKVERKLRVFQPGLYLSLDYHQGHLRHLQFDPSASIDPSELKPELEVVERQDELLAEIQSFVHAIQGNTPPVVSAEAGLQAMEIAWEIKHQIQQSDIA